MKILTKKTPKINSKKGFGITEESQRFLTIFKPENRNLLFAANPQPVTSYQTFREWFQEGWRHTSEEQTENSEHPSCNQWKTRSPWMGLQQATCCRGLDYLQQQTQTNELMEVTAPEGGTQSFNFSCC